MLPRPLLCRWNVSACPRLFSGRRLEDWSQVATRAEVEAVYRSHGGLVWRACLTMAAGNRDVADEATAEAFARLLAHAEGVREPVAWVCRTAFRITAKDLARRRTVVAGGMSDRAAPERSLLPSHLTTALARLSPSQRVAVFLRYFADLPVDEIAALTGSPIATVRVRLHRARRSLRESFEVLGGEHV